MLKKGQASEIAQGQLLYVLYSVYSDRRFGNVIGVYEDQADAEGLRVMLKEHGIDRDFYVVAVPFDALGDASKGLSEGSH